MYAIDFEFDGKRLSDYGCILTSFEGTTSGAFPSGADITFSYAKPLGSDIFNLHSAGYDTPYTATFSFCKNPCDNVDEEDMYFTPIEASTIQRWLCRRNHYCKFKFLEEGYEDIYWMGSFTSQQYKINGKIIGFTITFTADAPYAYLEDVDLHYVCAGNTAFTVDSMSYEEGYIVPDITITLTEGGDFSLSNNRDTKTLEINNCTNGEIITISGKTLIINSSNSSHDLGEDFNFIFPKLFNTYENTVNVFTPNLGCKIDITYTPVIKVGI